MPQASRPLSDAETFGQTYGPDPTGAPAPETGGPMTSGQQAYSSANATFRDPHAEPGTPTNPTYDTPSRPDYPNAYHVDAQGRLHTPPVAPADQAGRQVPWSDEQIFGAFTPGQGFDTRPTSQDLGVRKGANIVDGNILAAISGRLPTLGNPLLKQLNPASLLTLPLQSALRSETSDITEQEKTVRPGEKGKIAGELLASAPFALEGEGITPLVLGADQGFLTSEAHDPLGKARDMTIGAIGGKLGGMAVGGASRVVLPEIRPAAQWAIDNNIRLTPGAITNGAGKVIETGLAKGTIAGPAIGGAQMRSLTDFNLQTIQKHALDPVGLSLPEGVAAGHDAVNASHKLLSDAYDALSPNLVLNKDADLLAAVSEVKKTAAGLPAAYRARLTDYADRLGSRRAVPLTGDEVQELTSTLRQEAADAQRSGDFFTAPYGRAIDKLSNAVNSGLERSNPAQAETLRKLNQGYAAQIRIERAASQAVQDGGVFTPKSLLAAVKATDQSARDNATARGQALLQDWANAGKEVLPDAVPRPGSIWAHLPELGVALGVGKEAHMPGLAGMLATEGGGALLYTEPGRAFLQKMLTERPTIAARLAPMLEGMRPLGGFLGGEGAVQGAQAALPALPAITLPAAQTRR